MSGHGWPTREEYIMLIAVLLNVCFMTIIFLINMINFLYKNELITYRLD